MQILICHTDLLCDQPIFVAQFVAQQKVFRAEDHQSGLTIPVYICYQIHSYINTSSLFLG